MYSLQVIWHFLWQQLLLRWQRVRARVIIWLLVWSSVRIRVRVSFNISISHWSNCPRANVIHSCYNGQGCQSALYLVSANTILLAVFFSSKFILTVFHLLSISIQSSKTTKMKVSCLHMNTLLKPKRHSLCSMSWFTHNYSACAPMLYISELCKDCAVANEIDYAWASIHDNGHVITACDVSLQQHIANMILDLNQMSTNTNTSS